MSSRRVALGGFDGYATCSSEEIAMKSIWLAALFIVGGCYYSDPQVSARYSVGYGYGAPSMAYVGPGVDVVMDYDYPVFFSDGYYWRYNGGLWYRSGYYDRGWSVNYNVPYAVRGISRPESYVRYRGGSGYQPNQNWGRRNVPVAPSNQAYRSQPAYRPSAPAYRPSAPVYRPAPSVYRAPSGGVYRGGAPRPVVRDHR